MSQFYIFLPTWDVYHVPSFLLNARNRAVKTRDKNRSPTEFHSNKLLDLFLLALILGIISCLNILPQFSSVAQSCLTLCDPMDYRRQASLSITNSWSLLTIQPSHPLSSPSPLTFNHSQHQGLFKWLSSLHQVAKKYRSCSLASVLPMNIQDWFPLRWTCWISLQCKGLSRVFSNTAVQKHQFIGAQLSLQSNSHIHTWLLEKP